MRDLGAVVRGYVGELSGARADDAYHALLELGAVALPHVEDAFRLARDAAVRLRLAQVVCHTRSINALAFLAELLHDDNTEIWKTALDGLVMVADQPTARTQALEVLASARERVDSRKRNWIDEAVGQLPSANGPA